MNDFDSSLMTALRDEADRATGNLDTVAATERLQAGLDRADRDRTRRAWTTGLATAAAAVVVVAIALLASQSPHSTPRPIGPPSPDVPGVSKKLVLHLHSWGGANPECPRSDARTVGCRAPVDLAVYADGWVIWGHQDMEGYDQIRLSPEGLAWLKERIRSTGLFERDLALGVDGGSGDLEFHGGGRPVIVAWGQKSVDVSGVVGMQDRFVEASPAQANDVVELEKLLRDPDAWALPPGMFLQREPSPFIPTHLWVSWDRSKPDPSQLPSPAREVLTSNLEAVLRGGCEVISIAQAQEIADAMEKVGLIGSDDVADGIAFDMPGQGSGHAFLHAHPALPNESTCDRR